MLVRWAHKGKLGYIPPSCFSTHKRFSALDVSCRQVDTLYAGEVGYLAAQIKSVLDARVGDTVTLQKVCNDVEGLTQRRVHCVCTITDF